MELPALLTMAFPPSANRLLDVVRRDVDDAMLMLIARADYGMMADEMLAELRPLRDDGVLPSTISGQLHEVLALTRWANPEMPNQPPFEPGPMGSSGHRTRLFACAILLRLTLEHGLWIYADSDDSTLASSLASARMLGDEISEALACFLTAYMAGMPRDVEPPLFALALLILATRLRQGRFPDQALVEIGDWVISQDAGQCAGFPLDPSNPRPLPFSIQAGFWKPVAEEFQAEIAAIQTPEVREKLRLCALLLGTDGN